MTVCKENSSNKKLIKDLTLGFKLSILNSFATMKIVPKAYKMSHTNKGPATQLCVGR